MTSETKSSSCGDSKRKATEKRPGEPESEFNERQVLASRMGRIKHKLGELVHIFGSAGGQSMAKEMRVPFLGTIPIETEVVNSGDEGRPVVQSHPHSETSRTFGRIIRKLLEPDLVGTEKQLLQKQEVAEMKIAVPVTQGSLSLHFGHCEHFALFEVDSDGKTIRDKQFLTPPGHEPGILPRWLHEHGANVVITGGMGARAQGLFAQNNIKVVVGAAGTDLERIVEAYLDGSLETGANVCDH
ncbi:MAG: P-loop NTPase [Candidatus Eisenbacteria sp.]|nr:P-loop NTPase [Candidatus Eisenbacteria bacterium]